MRNPAIEVGQQFGKLTVLGPTDEYKNGKRLWLCQCECNKQAKIIANHLKMGVKSCGCVGGQKSFATGHRVGRLTVVGPTGKSDQRGKLWACKCDCDNDIDVPAKDLKAKLIRSCGCLAKDNHKAFKERNTTHGQTGSLLYRLWRGVIDRCHNPGSAGYSYYGARGIEVCPEWRNDFDRFIQDMGHREPRQSLDRIDVNGPYSKENCRWSTHQEQQNNRRNNVVLTHNGRTLTVAEWAKLLEISQSTLFARMRSGWSVEDVLTRPVSPRSQREPDSRRATRDIYTAMKQRCQNPNCNLYKDYGGRGIRVCAWWDLGFSHFLADMGECPPGASLDRIDVNGNYFKENCRWASSKEQSNNKRSSVLLTHSGETRTVSEWAEVLGTRRETLEGRLRMGWPVERVLDTTIRRKKGV